MEIFESKKYFQNTLNKFISRNEKLLNNLSSEIEAQFSISNSKSKVYIRKWKFNDVKKLLKVQEKFNLRTFIDEKTGFKFDVLKSPHYIYYDKKQSLYIVYVKATMDIEHVLRFKKIINFC